MSCQLPRAFGAQALHDRQPIELGQSEVDDREVERVLAGEEEAFLAVLGLVDAVALVFQLAGEPEPQRRIVLDQQQAHGLRP